MKRVIVLLTLALCALGAVALPTVEEVQNEVRQGRHAQAETLMKEVVAARPNSAKGHYVYAELLAHNGKREQALQEVQLARQIDPELRFTTPEKFRAFEQSLQRQASPSPAPAHAPAASRGIPTWVWGIAGLALAILVWRKFSNRQAQGAAHAGSMGTGYPQGPMGGPGGGPMGNGGNGMLGAGLAGVGGFAAGMLAEKLLNGQDAHAAPTPDNGLAPGHFDERADPAQGIDFGSGGDWGGDSNASIDSGASGGGGGDDW
jgi:hypothetical protein